MKVTVNRKALAEATRTALVPAVTNHLPILSCVRLDAEGATVTVTGTNLDITVTAAVSAEVHRPGSVIVPGKVLADLLKAASDDVATLVLEGDWVAVECGRAEAKLCSRSVVDWPKVGPAEGERFELGAADMGRLAAVQRAVSTNPKDVQNRPVLAGVHFAESRAEATDGSVFITASLGVSDLPDVVVPGDVVHRVVRNTPEAFVTFGDRTVTFTSSDETISWTSTLISAKFPDMIRWLRKDSQHALTVERVALDRAVDVVKPLADEHDYQPVDLRFEDDLLVLSAVRQDVGDIRDVVPCTSTFDFPMRFHLQFLGLLCDLLDGDDITLEVEDAMKPVIARTEDWRLAVVVGPMKPPA